MELARAATAKLDPSFKFRPFNDRWQVLLIKFFGIVLPVLVGVAFMTLFERKVLAAAGKRVGPNVVGYGFLQPFADGLKLLTKETIIPSAADRGLYLLAPVVSFGLALLGYAVLPVGSGVVDMECTLLVALAISGLSVYGVVLAGWSSNSRYAFLGALRASAQMISYEVSLGLILMCNCLATGTMNLGGLAQWQSHHVWLVGPLLPGAVLLFLSALAETNRPPFDLPEAEGELVAGYYVEYASAGFALFFIAEYANIILLSALWGVLFTGGFNPGVVVGVMFGFIWVRSAYPRYRYDQLMRLGWKCFLPASLALFYVVLIVVQLNIRMQKFHKFHLVDQSPWPLAVSAALFTTVVGLVLSMHGYADGFGCFVWGLFNTGSAATFWFRDVVREATFGGHHTRPVQRGLRMGFTLFILSEVMFFFSFFWAFFYAAVNPAIELGGVWPPPGIVPVVHWGLAAHNTGLLLLSGCTLTWSHYALVAGDKQQAFTALGYTCLLGLWFLQCQAAEFDHGCAYGISDSVYGAVFFLLTGFHGVHVVAGTLFLLVCLGRLRANHFTHTRHVGFLMAIWYWHFVDVVWLMLYLFVYVWGPYDTNSATYSTHQQ